MTHINRSACRSPWLQPDHPDPKGTTLNLLASVLNSFIEKNLIPVTNNPGTYGVFLDFSSCHQKDAAGKRTDAEAALFGRALGNLSDIYSHPFTLVLKVTKMPKGYPSGFTFPSGSTANTADYYGRGWCFCESALADLTYGTGGGRLDLGFYTGKHSRLDDVATECTFGEVGLKWGRDIPPKRMAPPMPPNEFALLLETKSFTSKKADLANVQALYSKAFTKRIEEAVELDFSWLGWGDEEAKVLAKTLAFTKSLRSLDIKMNMIGDEGFYALAAALRQGAARKLRRISGLSYNRASEAAKQALLSAFRER
jgi:hypothetical protein